ncbi:MAG: serpin family protein [Eubacterium sp.]|nr:serpin family protein [Eubacterium sp.]
MKQIRKSEKLYDGITDINENLVKSAQADENKTAGSHWKKRVYAAAAVALAAAAAVCIMLWPRGAADTVTAHALAEADYPEMAPFPDETKYMRNGELDFDAYMEDYDVWWADIRQRGELTGYEKGLDGFLQRSTKQFLSGAGEKNIAYSPLNVYMALGMLAELTDGDSRQQVLDLLGSGDMEQLRRQASDLWNANYRSDGAVYSVLASSIWLNEDVDIVQKTMDTLAEIYYASAYQGKMGSKELNQMFQNWLNEQTGGLLKEQVSSIGLNPQTVLALATTVHYQAKWYNEFSKEKTKAGVFHTASKDVDCDFMHKEKSDEHYYWGEKFSAVAQNLDESGSMWFILPDEGVSIDELLSDEQAVEFLMSEEKRAEWEDKKYLMVNLSVPVFDITSQIQLEDGLKALGVTDVFDADRSDFSPMTKKLDGIYISTAEHAVRVTVDEEGVSAAAYTVMMADAGGAMPPEKEVDFILDRPFLFVITGNDGLPLFTGVVNDPVSDKG